MAGNNRRTASALVSTPERIALLWKLWDALAASLLQVMKKAAETGEPVRASMLNVVRAFLSDNNINADALRTAADHADAMAGLSQEFGEIEIDPDGNVVRLPTPTPTARTSSTPPTRLQGTS